MPQKIATVVPPDSEMAQHVAAVMGCIGGMMGGDALNILINVAADVIEQCPDDDRQRVADLAAWHLMEALYFRGALPRPTAN